MVQTKPPVAMLHPLHFSSVTVLNILVTGGAGFIGSHVVDGLLNAGHRVIVLDDLSSGRRENLSPRATLIEGDIGDRELIHSVFGEHSIDIVNHHAAQIDVRKSVADPMMDARINILGSLTLLEAAREHKVKRFIFASTGGAIYGEQKYFPADEEHPQQPISPYGITKRAVELYLEYYRAVHGLPYTVFRYANVYGPRQDPKGDAGVVAIFTNAMMSDKGATIFGTGEQTRDYVFVGDVVRAHVLLLDRGTVGSAIYNVSTGIETSVNELHRVLSDVITGGQATPIYADARKGELDRSSCSSAKITQALGWKPEVQLADGLKRTVDYFRSRE
jgi:UDP-glucose 4-epimerase